MRRALVLFASAIALTAGIAITGGSAATRHELAATWSGTLDGNGFVSGTAQTCSAGWSGKLQFDVAGTTLAGSGSVDITSQACTVKLPTPYVEHVDYTVTGTKDSAKNGNTQFTLFFHGQSVSPVGYDPSGFLAHFGQTNEGIPLVLMTTGARLDQTLANTLSIGSGTTVTLNDHFVLRISCDQDLIGKAQREYQTANSFADAGIKEGDEAVDNGAEIALGYPAEKTLEEEGELGIDTALERFAPKIAEEAVPGTILLQIGLAANDILFKILPAAREERELSKDAREDFDRADTWFDRANADLDKIKKEANDDCVGALHDELDSLLNKASLEERAQKKIEAWNAGGSTYLSPVTGEVLDEKTALAQARAIITGNARSPQLAGASPPKIKVTAAQLRGALKALQRAIADHVKAQAQLKRYQTATVTFLAQLRKLLKS